MFWCVLVNGYIFFEFGIRTSRSNQFNIFATVQKTNFTERDEPINDFKENFSESEYLAVNICQYIKIIFSDLVLILVSSFIDFALFVFVKRQEAKRRKLLPRTTATSSLVVAPVTLQPQSDQTAARNRISRMIILNGLNCFVMRLPLAVMSFYGFVFRFDRDTQTFMPTMNLYLLCKRFKLCQASENILFFLFMISFLFQFIIVYNLDKNFKGSVAHIWKKIRKTSN